MSVLGTAFRRTLEVVLPAHCVGCGTGGTYLCDRCVASMGGATEIGAPGARSGLGSVVAPFAYEGIARSAVHRLKYTGLRSLAPLMARPMADEARHLVLPSLVIVPIPLHPRRLRERGFNQSVLLAREVGRLLGIGVREEILFRRTQSGHQVDAVGAKARRANVADAFEASADASGLEVLLVDDVVTTGSTLAAAVVALGRAGASSVSGLAFAYEAKERRRERKPALSGLARGAPLS